YNSASLKWSPYIWLLERAGLSGPRSLRERLLRELVTFLHFFDRRSRPAILVFDVGADRPALTLQQLKHLADRRVALPPRRVVALILFAVLQMEVGDVRVMLADISHGIEVRASEVADVEFH